MKRGPRAKRFAGMKFMWDGEHYATSVEADEAKGKYVTDGFEVRIVDEEGEVHVYSRRLVTKTAN